MSESTVSSKYQVVIPQKVREKFNIKPGQKVQVIPYEGRIELVPIGDIKQSRGFLRGLDTRIEREPDRV